jgi:hypothetical protein
MEKRLEGEDKLRVLEREMRGPSGGKACPKCGAQVRDPFGGRLVIHDVAGCGGLRRL